MTQAKERYSVGYNERESDAREERKEGQIEEGREPRKQRRAYFQLGGRRPYATPLCQPLFLPLPFFRACGVGRRSDITQVLHMPFNL